MNINLASKRHSMTSIILDNHALFDACTTITELVDTIKAVFEKNNLNTQASRRLIQNVAKKKDFAAGLQTVYDSFLYGSKLAVDQK